MTLWEALEDLLRGARMASPFIVAFTTALLVLAAVEGLFVQTVVFGVCLIFALWANFVWLTQGEPHAAQLDALVAADAAARALTSTGRTVPASRQEINKARVDLLHAAHELARAAGGGDR